MSNLHDHAERELTALGYLDPESGMYGDLLGKAVLELVDVFAKQGHSGMSAPIVAQLFGKVAMFEPLGPLTSDDSEWNEVGTGVFQNKRCSHVFKDVDRFDGQAYDIEGRIFRDPDGISWTNRDSAVPIVFPYIPIREYVEREADE